METVFPVGSSFISSSQLLVCYLLTMFLTTFDVHNFISATPMIIDNGSAIDFYFPQLRLAPSNVESTRLGQWQWSLFNAWTTSPTYCPL